MNSYPQTDAPVTGEKVKWTPSSGSETSSQIARQHHAAHSNADTKEACVLRLLQQGRPRRRLFVGNAQAIIWKCIANEVNFEDKHAVRTYRHVVELRERR